jgi:anti-sigma B factor antagonist
MRNYFTGANTVAVLTVSERRCGQMTVLDLEGSVTLGDGTATLRRETRRLIAEGRADILLNLSDVRYVDSSGLGEMVAALAAARRAGGRVALLGLSPNVREVFAVTRLLTVFDIYEDEAGALRGRAAGQN